MAGGLAKGGLVGALLRVLIGVCVILAGTAERVTAQESEAARSGFFAGFGVGAGTYGSADCCRDHALTAYVTLGGALNSRILLGLEGSFWLDRCCAQSSLDLEQYTVAAIARLYPSSSIDLFFKGGAGLYSNGWSEGLGLLAGLGYDIRVRSGLSVTPHGSFAYGAELDGNPGDNYYAIQVGIGLTWH